MLWLLTQTSLRQSRPKARTVTSARLVSQMNKVSERYWKPEPELLAYLRNEPLRINPQPLQPPLERLQALQSDAICGIILVTKQFSHDGSASSLYITIVAAPSLAPLGEFSKEDPLDTTLQTTGIRQCLHLILYR
jgi:hypothetical protein